MQEQNVDCEVELDDILIHTNSYEKCRKDVELVVSLFSYFGYKINFSKSCLIPSQKIDFLCYTLDTVNRCFILTQEKLVKCRLIIKALSLLTSIKVKEDKNSIPQCIGQSHITTAFSNMVPFPSRTRVRQTCARCPVKTIKLYDIHGKRKQVMSICTGDRTFAGQTYYDGLS